MSFPEILEAIRNLPQVDKVQLLHELVNQVAQPSDSEETLAGMLSNRAVIVSPIFGPETAPALAALLAEERRS